MRKLLAFYVLAGGLTAVCFSSTLPLRVGAVNDYGQTLDRRQREELRQAAELMGEQGLELVYLATWRDPFSDPDLYARRVFSAWELGPNAVLIVLVRDDRGRWWAVGHLGDAAASRFPAGQWESLRQRAQTAANLGPAGTAAVSWASGLARPGEVPDEQAGGGGVVWPAVATGAALAVFLVMARRRLCPQCLRPLRRRRSWGGIMLLCPRCRYTRVTRRGSGPGSRGGIGP